MSGDLVFLGASGQVQVWDVSDARRPVHRASLPITPYDLVADGSWLYLSLWSEGIAVVSVENPDQPRDLGELKFDQAAAQITVDGDHLYVAVADGVRVVDIADPNHPQLVGVWGAAGTVTGVATLRENRAVASFQYPTIGDGCAIVVLDMSDPTAPRQIDLLRLGGSSGRLAARNDIVAMADNSYLRLVAATDTSALREVWVSRFEESVDVVIVGSFLYLQSRDGVRIFDISWPEQTQLQTFLPSLPGEVKAIAAADGLLLSAAYGGFRLYDGTIPGQPITLFDGWTVGLLLSVDEEDGLAVTLDDSGVVSTVDVSDPTRPRFLGRIGVMQNRYATPMAVYLRDGRAYMLPYGWIFGGSLYVVDVHDPRSPRVESDHSVGYAATGADHDGDRLYVTANCLSYPRITRHVHVEIWNIGDSAPVGVIGSRRIGDNQTCEGLTVAASDGLAWVGSDTSGLYVLDTTDPANMKEYAHVALPDRVRVLAASGRRAIVTTAEVMHLMELDADGVIRDHAGPPNALAGSAHFDGQTLVSNGPGGWRLFDVSDPDQWLPIGNSLTTAGHFAIDNDLIFTAAFGYGLDILRRERGWRVYLPAVANALDRNG